MLQLIYKVRSGASVEDAVEDIITRGVGELRKNAFGDDADDAKNLPWSREQAWGLMKRFINKSEVSEVLCFISTFNSYVSFFRSLTMKC